MLKASGAYPSKFAKFVADQVEKVVEDRRLRLKIGYMGTGTVTINLAPGGSA